MTFTTLSSRELSQNLTRVKKATQNGPAVLDISIARGLADMKAGRVRPASEVFDRLEAKYTAMLNQRI
ncbi:MAG: hypothetical protein LBE21_00685 [Pseudomonadales bacterium]|jgi:antitoxin ParD1/3/4|nr:hypothetical protein [Pseudomonadales bacterium]